jgi:hypothetical protein
MLAFRGLHASPSLAFTESVDHVILGTDVAGQQLILFYNCKLQYASDQGHARGCTENVTGSLKRLPMVAIIDRDELWHGLSLSSPPLSWGFESLTLERQRTRPVGHWKLSFFPSPAARSLR